MTGSLEHVLVGDLLHFVHLGCRTGTLVLESGGKSVEVCFHRGRIVSARAAGATRIGELLVRVQEIQRHDLDAALRILEREPSSLPICRLLVQMGAIRPERLNHFIARHFEETVYALATWSTGSFDFIPNELRPVDDVSVAAGDLLSDIKLNTTMLIAETTRISTESRSEANQRDSGPRLCDDTLHASEPSKRKTPASPSVGATLHPGSGDVPVQSRVQIVSRDVTLTQQVEGLLTDPDLKVVRVGAIDAGSEFPGEAAPVVLLDTRPELRGIGDIASLKRTRPSAATVAIVDCPRAWTAAIEAGALAAVPPEAPAIRACLTNVLRERRKLQVEDAIHTGLRVGFAKLRRFAVEVRSGLLNSSVTLNLMNIASESVERGIFLLVRNPDLLALGAFGYSGDKRLLADCTRGLGFPLATGGIIEECAREASSKCAPFDEARLPVELATLLGRPASGECAVIPVAGVSGAVAVMYVDNHRRDLPIDALEFLELAAAQVGMAYENELLRVRLQEAEQQDKKTGDLPQHCQGA